MMVLREYRKKRDFERTPEPSGQERGEATPGRMFVVQKHAASRLHYDFRLELDGVLKSWAIPKGPHLDPAAKSLAVHVEDHPLGYASFEGVIPEDEYGGGTVMVWDRGQWEPEGDPRRDYEKGRLKFTLQGEKLRGGWSLVRMQGKAGDGGKNWLLIKRKDDEARPDYDLLEEESLSVHTGRDLSAIGEDADRVWTGEGDHSAEDGNDGKKPRSAKKSSLPMATFSDSKATEPAGTKKAAAAEGGWDAGSLPKSKKSKQPTSLPPALATLSRDVPEGDDWLHELKFDGYRILAVVRNGKARLLTRNGKNWTDRFPSVAAAVEKLPLEQGILDGEVVAMRPDGTTDFQKLQNWMKRGEDDRLAFYVFDLPHCDGYDLTACPLDSRKELLARIVLSGNSDAAGVLRYSDHIRGQGKEVVEHSCRAAMEGIVSKRADSPYRTGRSTDWLKIKCLNRQEFVVGGYTKPSGSRAGFGSLLLGVYEGKQLVYCGRVGTGFDAESLADISQKLKKIHRKTIPFDDAPAAARRKGTTWVEPRLVAEVEFTEWTDDGHLRHPSFQGLREDKPPKQIVREEPKAMQRERKDGRAAESGKSIVPSKNASSKIASPKNAPGKSSGRSKHTNSRKSKSPRGDDSNAAEVAGVRLSSPGRILYPAQGVTKLDLAHYYEEIADWILPHVVDRPLTLVRCPQGRRSQCFYQKHLTEAMPAAVRGVEIAEKNGKGTYVVIDDLAGLISLVQLGVLEMHPWNSRTDRVERPDRLVFDLDPGEGTGWEDVVRGARDVKERLDDLHLESFLRTSGGKGLHVVVPIVRRTSWDDAREFAKGIAETLTRDFPERYIATMSKAKRKGKIFVDYLRNSRGATAIASYSTRARENAPVAAPLRWDELSSSLSPTKYTVRNLPRRLSSLKDDPWAGFFDANQSLTKKMLRQ